MLDISPTSGLSGSTRSAEGPEATLKPAWAREEFRAFERLAFRAWGFEGSGFRVQGSGFRVQGLGFRSFELIAFWAWG